MPTKTFVRVICASALFASLTAGAALAQTPFERRTMFTFSGPTAVPGVTLQAGEYMFRLASNTRRDVVHVLSADGKTPYAMFFAIPEQRPDVPKNPEIRFMETAVGMPAAVKTWWYPGQRTGWEFIYPKEQARLLAKGTGEPVLTTVPETKTAPETTVAELTRITPAGAEAPVAEVAATPAGPYLEGEVAALPKTASAIPVVALSALALLLGAGLLRLRRVTFDS